MRERAAILLLAHCLAPRVARLHARLEAAAEGWADVFLACYLDDPAALPEAMRRIPRRAVYGRDDLLALPYPAKAAAEGWRILPGNNDLVTLRFAADHPGYAAVWGIEGDVDYTGDLAGFFAALAQEPADLLCVGYLDRPRAWEHAARSQVPPGWPGVERCPRVVFLPVFRASAAMIEAVDGFYRAGGDGHFEWVWAYAAETSGLRIADIGGSGPYVAPHLRNRFYRSVTWLDGGTMRFWPIMTRPGRRANMLWHPIKDGARVSRFALLRPQRFLLERWLKARAPRLHRRVLRLYVRLFGGPIP